MDKPIARKSLMHHRIYTIDKDANYYSSKFLV